MVDKNGKTIELGDVVKFFSKRYTSVDKLDGYVNEPREGKTIELDSRNHRIKVMVSEENRVMWLNRTYVEVKE